MPRRSPVPSLTDIVDAIGYLWGATGNLSFEEFEANRQLRWAVERGVEIISEASRRLPDELKARHQEIPWRKIADIGNVLRHNYQAVSPPIMWNLVHNDLLPLETACRTELLAEAAREQEDC